MYIDIGTSDIFRDVARVSDHAAGVSDLWKNVVLK
jgi:hypothetical protein